MSEYTFAISRVEMPPRPHLHTDPLLTGGQFEWTWAVALPYRILADPHGAGVMPISPLDTIRHDENGSPQGNSQHARGYYGALQSFLTYSFGWTRHDLGLLWWYQHGRPVDDPRLALLRATWDADGMLERYLAWCLERSPGARWEAWPGEPLRRWARNVNQASAELSGTARSRIDAQQRAAKAGDPFASPWEKHLERGDHIGAPSTWPLPTELAGAARLVGADRNKGRATLISDHTTGWYSSLAKLTAQFTRPRAHPDWRIEVYVRPIGYVGEYRRSAQTGLWFSGRHRHHLVGN